MGHGVAMSKQLMETRKEGWLGVQGGGGGVPSGPWGCLASPRPSERAGTGGEKWQTLKNKNDFSTL